METLYFNPHSREGSDADEDGIPLFGWISIHTPAKGVTVTAWFWMSCIHDFNPHSREGSDHAKNKDDFIDRISIHTPAKGVTNLEQH